MSAPWPPQRPGTSLLGALLAGAAVVLFWRWLLVMLAGFLVALALIGYIQLGGALHAGGAPWLQSWALLAAAFGVVGALVAVGVWAVRGPGRRGPIALVTRVLIYGLVGVAAPVPFDARSVAVVLALLLGPPMGLAVALLHLGLTRVAQSPFGFRSPSRGLAAPPRAGAPRL